MHIADQPIIASQPVAADQDANTIDIAEIAYAIADLTKVVDYLATTNVLPPRLGGRIQTDADNAEIAVTLERLRELTERLS
jgi:hypothetical protein